MDLVFDASDAPAAVAARRACIIYLRERGAPGSDYDAAELIFGELIGNVVKYAPGPIRLSIGWADERSVLRVEDQGPGFTYTPHLPPDPLSEGGRGLYLVALLTVDFRIERSPGGGTRAVAILPVRRRSS